ncbi:MAG: glycoside hydrolase family 19 protein [Polyangia bacterium]
MNLSTLHSAASYPHSVSKTTTAITAHFDKQRHPFRRFLFASLLLCGISAGCSGTSSTGDNPSPSQDGATTNGSDGGTTGGAALSDLLPEALFNQIFLHRGTSPCPGAFYTYQSFVDAARAFPGFATQGTMDDRKRELAAFLANISHETTGGWATAPDGPYSWGLCFIHEGGNIDPSTLTSYCVASAQYPCAPGKKYYGRGPIQLSYNYNYGQAGAALGVDLLNNPDLVGSDPVLAWKTALWFWMTPQAPKPSCHNVMIGQFAPSTQDLAAGRKPGFGLTVNIINGGVECNQPTPAQVTDRVGFYNRYSQLLGVSPGTDLYCDKMQSY